MVRTSLPNRSASRLLWFSVLATKISAKLADYIVACGQNCGLQHINFWNLPLDRLRVIHNTRQTLPWSQYSKPVTLYNKVKLSEFEFIISCIARKAPQKAQENLIGAARLLSRATKLKICLIFCGHGTETLTFEEERLSALGLGPDGDVESLAEISDVHCSCSIDGEGFQNVILEMLAHGCFSVSSLVGEADKLVVDDRLLVEPGCEESLADALLYFSNARYQSERRRLWTLERKRILSVYSEEQLYTKWGRFIFELERCRD